jgi:mevalonate kinase
VIVDDNSSSQDSNRKDETNNKMMPEQFDQYYYGHGKLLLSGEYFIMDGARGLALPTKLGQSMGVRYSPSFSPKLTWRAFDDKGELWFEGHFEYWQFKCLDDVVSDEAKVLQKLLKQARKQNQHFLREEQDVYVETHLAFPLQWGLGSSSSLIYNMAQWAYISPFELLFNTQGGSGYDIACAQSDGPIAFEKNSTGPKWGPVTFNPSFSDQLYFIYLGQKQRTSEGIEHYKSKGVVPTEILVEISDLTDLMLEADDPKVFKQALLDHERVAGTYLNLPTVGDKFFNDFNGATKSLGAWGGDFILAMSDQGKESVSKYFNDKGHDVVLSYDEIILKTPSLLPTHEPDSKLH